MRGLKLGLSSAAKTDSSKQWWRQYKLIVEFIIMQIQWGHAIETYEDSQCFNNLGIKLNI